MPWKETSAMEERMRFVSLAESGRFEIVKLCRDFGISRKSGYKWIKRYREHGSEGMKDLSRSPKRVPGRTDEEVEALVVLERRRHPTWGAKKIEKVLEVVHEVEGVPARSTIGEILKRNGMVEARRRKPGAFKVERSELQKAERSNHVWATDYKGWFHLGDGTRCDPLTVSDLHSRYLIRLEAVPQATQYWSQKGFERAFERHGMPEVMRVDNGSPFGSIGPGGLSKLSVWWVTLGIRVEFTRPGCPQDNGSHERMHRTMKAECCQPASENRWAQQRRFERWRKHFNEERPHEAISYRFPAEVYQASARRYDSSVKMDLYETWEQTHQVGESGMVYWKGRNWAIGEAFVGQKVVMEANPEPNAAADTRLVRFANVKLGIIGDHVFGRLRPTASDGQKRKKSCKKQEPTS
jgi:transposase InsO family protein